MEQINTRTVNQDAPVPAQLKALNGVVAALARDQGKIKSYDDKSGRFWLPASIETAVAHEGSDDIVDVRHRFLGRIGRTGAYRQWSLWSLRLFEDFYAVHEDIGYKQHNVYSFEWTHDKTLLAIRNIRVAYERIRNEDGESEPIEIAELGGREVAILEGAAGTWSDLSTEVHDDQPLHEAQYQLLKVTADDCEQLIENVSTFRELAQAIAR